MLGTKDIDIKIGATDATGTAFHSAEARMKGFVGSAKSMMGALGIGFGVKTLMSAAGNAVEYASSLNDASVATQTNVEALQALRHVAKLTGASYGQLDKALITLNDNAEKAAKAMAETTEKKSTTGRIKEIENYSDALSKLGVDMGYFESQMGYNKIEAYITSIKNAEDSVEAFRQVLRIASSEDLGKVFRRLKIEDFPKWREMAAEMEIFKLKENEVKEATDSAVKAFQGLGIDPAVFKTLSGEGKIEELAKKFSSAKDQAAALSYAMDLMGTKNAPYLQQMLTELASKGLDPLIEKYKSLGMSKDQIKSLEEAGDNIDKFKIAATVKVGAPLAEVGGDMLGGKKGWQNIFARALRQSGSFNPLTFFKPLPSGDPESSNGLLKNAPPSDPNQLSTEVLRTAEINVRLAEKLRETNDRADTALNQIKTGRK